eukprot:scaffold4841_cov121-Isochrysis_galbana.AAC.2
MWAGADRQPAARIVLLELDSFYARLIPKVDRWRPRTSPPPILWRIRGIRGDDGVDFGIYFGWWALFCNGYPCYHRQVVGVRRSREGGWGGAYLLPSPHRRMGLGIYPVNSSVNGVSEAGIARFDVPVDEAECIDHAAIGHCARECFTPRVGVHVAPPRAGYLTSRSLFSTQLKSPPVMACSFKILSLLMVRNWSLRDEGWALR